MKTYNASILKGTLGTLACLGAAAGSAVFYQRFLPGMRPVDHLGVAPVALFLLVGLNSSLRKLKHGLDERKLCAVVSDAFLRPELNALKENYQYQLDRRKAAELNSRTLIDANRDLKLKLASLQRNAEEDRILISQLRANVDQLRKSRAERLAKQAEEAKVWESRGAKKTWPSPTEKPYEEPYDREPFSWG